MSKAAWKIAQINLRNCKLAYWVAGVTALVMLLQGLVYLIIFIASGGTTPFDNASVSVGCVLWLAPLLAAIFIPTGHFRKVVNLGGKRGGFVLGCLVGYVLMALGGALANTLIFYSLDRFIQNTGVFTGPFGGAMNLIEVFGWIQNGPIVAFLQQFALLFLTLSAVHTLVAAQDKWYGWAADLAIAAVISVFTPITALRPALTGFFGLIIFQPNALLQVSACLALGIAVFALNKPIFARKAI